VNSLKIMMEDAAKEANEIRETSTKDEEVMAKEDNYSADDFNIFSVKKPKGFVDGTMKVNTEQMTLLSSRCD
jgi:hypothetical protein